MSKKKFETPIVEIVCIRSADIMTASTDAFDGVWVPIGGNKINDNSNFSVF